MKTGIQPPLLLKENYPGKKLKFAKLNQREIIAEQLIEATPDFIMLFNLVKNKIEYINRQAYKGDEERYKESLQIDYSQILDRAHPDDRKAVHNFIEQFRTAQDDNIKTLQYRVVNKSHTIWYNARGKVFKRNKEGKPTHYISIIQDITKLIELKEAKEELLQIKIAQNKEIMIAQEIERKRIAESLHNDLGQLLYVAKLKVQNNQKDEAEKLLSSAIAKVRTISFELMPVILKDYGLNTALQNLIEKRIKPENIKITYKNELPHFRFREELEITVFRIIQELFNNMVKYSKATESILLITYRKQEISIELQDNGIGFSCEKALRKSKGFGLISIKNKVELFNGTFNITSEKDKGTNIKVHIPLS